MAHGVGDDLLDAAPHDVGLGGTQRRQVVSNVDIHDRARHRVPDRAQLFRELRPGTGCFAQLTDHLANVTEQVGGDGAAYLEVVLDRPGGGPGGDLEVDRQGRELVANDVVQVAGDPQPLLRATGRRQLRLRGPQRRVGRLGLPASPVARTDTTMSSAKSWKAKNATPVDTAYAIPPSLNVVHNRATTASVWTRTMPTTTRTDTRLARRIAVITNEIEVNPLEEESATTATPSGVTTPSAMARSRLGQ